MAFSVSLLLETNRGSDVLHQRAKTNWHNQNQIIDDKMKLNHKDFGPWMDAATAADQEMLAWPNMMDTDDAAS